MIIVCKTKACSRCSVLSAAAPGTKSPKKQAAARQGIAGPRGTNRRFAINACKYRTSAVPLFTHNGKVVTLKGG